MCNKIIYFCNNAGLDIWFKDKVLSIVAYRILNPIHIQSYWVIELKYYE